MKRCIKLNNLSDIKDLYDVFLIDLWGVIHNGIAVFENVIPVLENLKQKNKMVFFITNAPRRSSVISQQLEEFGIAKGLYKKIVSSGELTWHNIKEKYQNKNCLMIGPPRDNHLIEGLNVKIVDKDSDVDIILNTGPWGDDDCLENYTELLDCLAKKGSNMICSNPDKTVVRGENFMICAGLLAEYYEKIGGKVEYYGKPFKQIYEYCFNFFEKKNNKVLVIGDSLENDIKGANNLKFDSLLITDGIHREVNNNNDVDKQKLDALIKTKNIFPDFYMRKLT
jgi:HAD superfamily hydrolase (TIGR01459 family)|tara:strand:+ start:234 stop:1076 length:843 start_codon:yes stop_codon:yes gene_type:complete